MIKYNPKDWFTFIFKFHKTETLVRLKWLMILIGLYAAVVATVEKEVLQLTKDSHVNGLTTMHSMLGFVISLLLVFRTNTAYDRWWEGRRQWGALVNNSRNLGMKLNAMLSNDSDRKHMRLLISNYAFALKNHLRGRLMEEEFEYDEVFTKDYLHKNKHIPNQIAKAMYEFVHQLHQRKDIDGSQLLFVNNELQSFTDICGACERIKNTPIPFSYSIFLKKFIFFFVMTLPIGFVFVMGYIVVPFTMFLFYVLSSIEIIGEEIEDPFGEDTNDLPTDSICLNIRRSLNELA
jgi:putative membrane protein